MSAPKKPGTDLAALKARLAKKTQGEADTPEATPEAATGAAPAAAAQPLAQVHVPAPGEVAAAIPAPGEVAYPAADVPAPGQQYVAPAPAPVAAPSPADDAPFGGGGSFDPGAGLIDDGSAVPAKSNVGLVAFGVVGGLLIGALFGWVGRDVVSKRELVALGKAKGAEMVAEVAKVAYVRKTISLAFAEVKESATKDPAAAATRLTKLLTEELEPQTKADALFGPEYGRHFAAVKSAGINQTLQLFDNAAGLRVDLGYLAGYLDMNKATLKEPGGPALFAVLHKQGGGVLVGLTEALCAGAEEGAEPTACPASELKNAVALKVLEGAGAEPTTVPIGMEEGKATILVPGQGMWNYAIGQNPEKYGITVLGGFMQRVESRLEEMAKSEEQALAALQKYASDPAGDAGE